ncbi:MAG: hypothetical protein GY950_24135 [bacterium]|nr:hypothetical protein [bacterium]
MKNWLNRFGIALEILLVVVIVILSASLFVYGQTAQTTQTGQPLNPDPLTERLTKLQQKLKLDETQTINVQKILENEREQAATHRQSLKNDALTLIKTAHLRRKTTNAEIEKILTPGQIETFKEIAHMNRFDRDLFELTEGIILTDDQAFTVEGILIDYYNKINEMMPERMRERSERGMGGTGPGGKEPTGERMADPGEMPKRQFSGMKRMMKSFERKKNRDIKKILTDQQKERFSQIRKDRKEKRKARAARWRKE